MIYRFSRSQNRMTNITSFYQRYRLILFKNFRYLVYNVDIRASSRIFFNHILNNIRSQTSMLQILFKYEN
jgi:hypothetical protein